MNMKSKSERPLHIRNFPVALKTALKILALKRGVTLYKLIIDVLTREVKED